MLLAVEFSSQPFLAQLQPQGRGTLQFPSQEPALGSPVGSAAQPVLQESLAGSELLLLSSSHSLSEQRELSPAVQSRAVSALGGASADCW